jgi:hypothetical protein
MGLTLVIMLPELIKSLQITWRRTVFEMAHQRGMVLEGKLNVV